MGAAGRRPGFLLALSPPAFPEHFCELAGFEAPHPLQRNESSGWHNNDNADDDAEVIILGRSFALSLAAPRQRLTSQDSCLKLIRALSPRRWPYSDRDRVINYVIQIPRLTQMRPSRLFLPASRRDTC